MYQHQGVLISQREDLKTKLRNGSGIYGIYHVFITHIVLRKELKSI